MLAKVLAPPYDVIDDAERADLEARDDHNIVRLTLPRDEPGADSPYDAAAVRLAEWRTAGILRPDSEPALYVYEKSYRLPMSEKVKGFIFNGMYSETMDFYAVHKE